MICAVRFTSNTLRHLSTDLRAVTAIEYALISVVSIGAVTTPGSSVISTFNTVHSKL